MVRHRISRVLFFAILAVSLAAVFVLAVVWASITYNDFQRRIGETRADAMHQYEQLIRRETEHALDYIRSESARVEERLRDEVRRRVEDALAVADNLYERNKDRMSATEIGSLVKEALRPIRYLDSSGYYFAFNEQGVEQLFADRPEYEGRDMLPIQDVNGQYVVRDMIDIVRRDGEGFYRYTWTMPGRGDQGHAKIAFVKRFAPLGWIIGSGAYVDDVDKRVRIDVVRHLEQLSVGKDGYVFAGQYDGLMVCGPNKGENALEMTDPEGAKIVQELIHVAKSGGGYVRYLMPRAGGTEPQPKLSYSRPVEDWGWFVGAGVYIGDIEEEIQSREAELRHLALANVGVAGSVVVAVLAMTFWVARRLAREFDREMGHFGAFFEQASTAGAAATIDAGSLRFAEFENLAHAANRMIADRDRAEQAVRESEQQFRTIFDRLLVGILIVDVETYRVEYANQAAADMLSTSPEQIVGRSCHDVVCDTASGRCPVIDDGKTLLNEERVLRKADGDKVTVIKTVTHITLHGRPCLLEAFIDLTDLKRAQEEQRLLEAHMQHVQKLESLGVLAGGVAHDFNNLLTGILGNADLALTELSSSSPACTSLDEIRKITRRAGDLCQQLLAYAGKGKFVVEPLDLREVVRDISRMLEVSISKRASLRYEFAEKVPAVRADVTQVRQVVMNLITNASEALGENGGEIVISVTPTTCTRSMFSDAFAGESLAEGPCVCLDVTDNGCGMTEDARHRIFEPFFTTKFAGRGLGMAAVLGIVHGHHGAITIDSEPGRGTTVRVFFPAANEEPHASESGSTSGADWVPRGTILLVDDDKTIRTVASRLLGKVGFRVLPAANGEEALDIYRHHREEIGVVILDLVMPGMDGEQTFAELRRISPDIPVLLSSGYGEQEVAERFTGKNLTGFIRKPYQMDVLLDLLRDSISQTPAQNASPPAS